MSPVRSRGSSRTSFSLILVQQGRIEEARRLIEDRWHDQGLSTLERVALLHDHIALDLETMPLDGNLEFLGSANTTRRRRRALAGSRQPGFEDRPARGSLALAGRCDRSPWG